MANSPAHRFGQIVGEVLETAVEPILTSEAAKNQLFLDKKGARSCRQGLKVSWKDINGNSHDLDFVLERGGSDQKQGIPAAFIEVAWRRYTKHSRAKAQEIQGAIMPLLEQHHKSAPFIGVILAGIFTKKSLKQLESLGFSLLYIPVDSVVRAFEKFGIDASADQSTPDAKFLKQVNIYGALSTAKKRALAQELLKGHENEVEEFIAKLRKALSRQVECILILPLHGNTIECTTVDEALTSLERFDEKAGCNEFVRYEIEIRYNNGDMIRGNFRDKERAIEFVKMYRPISPE